MAKSESSTRLKYSEGIDRISSLPEALHSRILSLLPTKNAVATSLLSTRWKFLWTSITDISIDNWHVPDTYSGEALIKKRQNFTQFLNSVLVLRNPPHIQNFHFKCDQELCEPFHLQLWISAAIGRIFQTLELSLMLVNPMELPSSHFNCKTLTVLKLCGDLHFNIVASDCICFPNLLTLHLDEILFTIASNCSVSFPSLKHLRLEIVRNLNEESVHKLFAGCPILDSLVFEKWGSDYIHCLIISIPSLQSLSISFTCSAWQCACCAYKIQIHTPALKYLYLSDRSMTEYLTLENLSCLLEATVKIGFSEMLCIRTNVLHRFNRVKKKEENIFKFIGDLVNVRFLSISGRILKAIGSISENSAPAFRNLTRLKLGRYVCHDWSFVIQNLLERSDNLEHLIMKGNSCCGSHESWWIEPLSVPMCLLRRVTTISLTAIGDCSSELELIRYFLKNAEVLKLLTIDCSDGLQAKIQLLKKISMIPRGSRACQVEFR